jgi:hypothetical protein
MKIEVISIPECPNHQPTVDAVNAVLLSESLVIPVIERTIHSAEEAKGSRFAGSPTVLVDGIDIEPAAKACASMACRIYDSGGGVPSAESLKRAIHRAIYEGGPNHESR